MPGKLEGRVALITGAARGQGRSHALRLASEGADIVAVDICAQIDTVPFAMSTPDDLAETVRQVEALDRRIVATQADVRDYDALKAAVDAGVAELGRLDVVSANAGIVSFGLLEELPSQEWQNIIDVNLTGVWHTAKAAIPHIKAGGRGGSMILTSSTAGMKVLPSVGAYAASKLGVVAVMRVLAAELGPDHIRVNCVHPTSTHTDMLMNDTMVELFFPDDPDASEEKFAAASQGLHVLPIPWVEAHDISSAVLFLASDDARYITATSLPVDAGAMLK